MTEQTQNPVFLGDTDIPARPLKLDLSGFVPENLFLGNGDLALEVVVFRGSNEPTAGTMHQAYKERRSGRAAPVLVVVIHDGGASLCGTNGNQPPVYHTGDATQAEGLCHSALTQPNRNAAIRYLANAMPSLETALPGIANEGLLSLHELIHRTKGEKDDWKEACRRSAPLRSKSDGDMLHALGFDVQPLDNLTKLLRTKNEKMAVAVLLNDDEVPESSNARFNNTSPISYALTKADRENLPWVMMIQGDRLRLYNTKNIGVGRRGRTETYVECQPALLSSDSIGLLWLLFSADALKRDGSTDDILKESKRFADDVANELRERIYDTVVPKLATGIHAARKLANPNKDDTALTYQMALHALFRLLFIAYAEDRDLLPYCGNESYRKRSLKQKAIELAETASKGQQPSKGNHHWTETTELWKAVAQGNAEWGVPAYNGTIFSSDNKVSPAGAKLKSITLPNKIFAVVLQNLLLTQTDDGSYAPLDFRALSVREFGTIYEGLLESELSLAEQDLSKDSDDTYMPASKGDEVIVHAGEAYLHDRSGNRKSSGSYYTPDFAVEHLLDGTLEPAIKEHLDRLSKLGDADRAERLFDFRVADIAMGSGHFLVAAIDRIERHFAIWLGDNHTPGVTKELHNLREAARKELGELADQASIEDGQLLRRMIARRCIYGVDLNPLAVQLARLSIWIHTFVPGLPLSLLDHNLVHGNALVGVGSLDEIRKKFDERKGTLLEADADHLLGQAAEPLKKLAQLSDASLKDITTGRRLMAEARDKTTEAEALCDLMTAQPVAEDPLLRGFNFESWEKYRGSAKGKIDMRKSLGSARKILEPLHALHFPIAFPEVFLSESEGFDVILGNPPWEEAVVNEDKFWARHNPGLASLPPREQEALKKQCRMHRPDLVAGLEEEIAEAALTRELLHAGNFPGMGTGDPDLYKAFCWRFWHLASPELGRIGVVLPRSATAAKGSETFRRSLYAAASAIDVTTLQNTGRWVFDIHPQYTIALTCIARGRVENAGITIKGPFDSIASFEQGKSVEAHRFTTEDVLSWSKSASLPLLPYTYSAEVFAQLRKSPNLDLDKPRQWRARPDREMDATNQRDIMDYSKGCPKGFWPVYKGASFGLWNPDTGEYNAWGNPKKILPWLQAKRLKANSGARDSVHGEFPRKHVEVQSTLAALHPRITFRDITNRTNNRTVIACLIPPETFITNTGPVILFPKGDQKDEAYLLGLLCSIPLDWYARRFVETHMNFFLFNSLPVPRPNRTSLLWQRVVKLAGRLACPDDRFAKWAAAVGVECGPLNDEDKQDKIHELDAVVAHLYGLSEQHLAHIFESFHQNWDHKGRLREVLRHYHIWRKTPP